MMETCTPTPIEASTSQSQPETAQGSRGAELMNTHGHLLADYFMDPIAHVNPRVKQADKDTADTLVQSLVAARQSEDPAYQPTFREISDDLSALYTHARDNNLTPNKKLFRNIMSSARGSFLYNRWNASTLVQADNAPEPIPVSPTELTVAAVRPERRLKLPSRAMAAVGSLAIAAMVAWSKLTNHDPEPAKQAIFAQSFNAPAAYHFHNGIPPRGEVFSAPESTQTELHVGQTAQIVFYFPSENGEFERVDGGTIVLEEEAKREEYRAEKWGAEATNGIVRLQYTNPDTGAQRDLDLAHTLLDEGKGIEVGPYAPLRQRIQDKKEVTGGYEEIVLPDGRMLKRSYYGKPIVYDKALLEQDENGGTDYIGFDPRLGPQNVVMCQAFTIEAPGLGLLGSTKQWSAVPKYDKRPVLTVAMAQR